MSFRRWNWALLCASPAAAAPLHTPAELPPGLEAPGLLRILANHRPVETAALLELTTVIK